MRRSDERYVYSSIGIYQTEDQVIAKLRLASSEPNFVGTNLLGMPAEAKEAFRKQGYKGCTYAYTHCRGGRVLYWYAGRDAHGWRYDQRYSTNPDRPWDRET